MLYQNFVLLIRLIVCNVMITEPVITGCTWSCHMSLTLGLHVTCQLHLSIFTASAINSSSHRCIVATTSSSLYRLGHQSVLAPFKAKVLRVANYLQTNAFPNLVVVEWEKCPHALQKIATRRGTSKVVKEMAGQTQPGLTLGTSTSASTIHHTTQWLGLTVE